MPEGPEIRLAADKVSAAVAGQRTQCIRLTLPPLKRFEKRLTGQTVTRIETRGKAMLTYFDNDWVVYSHNQLYGRWCIVAAGEKPKTKRQLRFEISTTSKSALLYSASDIDVLKVNKLHQHPFLAKLGPDILSEKPSVDTIFARLQSSRFCNRQLAGLLLDQSFLAGLGNYLRAEILLFAGLHPGLKPSQCTTVQLEQLSKQIIAVTERAYRTQGITNLPKLVKQLKKSGKKTKESYRFSAYGRENQPCYYCTGFIQRTNLGGRTMYSCPNCQPEA